MPHTQRHMNAYLTDHHADESLLLMTSYQVKITSLILFIDDQLPG